MRARLSRISSRDSEGATTTTRWPRRTARPRAVPRSRLTSWCCSHGNGVTWAIAKRSSAQAEDIAPLTWGPRWAIQPAEWGLRPRPSRGSCRSCPPVCCRWRRATSRLSQAYRPRTWTTPPRGGCSCRRCCSSRASRPCSSCSACSATRLGSSLADNRYTLEKVSAALIIAMGVLFVAAALMPALGRDFHVDALMKRAGKGGPRGGRPRLRHRLDPVRGAHAGGHPQRGSPVRVHWSRRPAARVLLAGPRRAVSAHRPRVRAHDTAFGWVKRHYGLIVGAGGVVLVAMGVLIWTGEFFQLNARAQSRRIDLGLDFWNDV